MYGRFLTIFIFLIGIWLNLIDFGSTDVAAFSHETKNEVFCNIISYYNNISNNRNNYFLI